MLARGQSFFHIHSIDCKIRTGLQVTEVAHDIQQQVPKYVVSEGLTNSYDTWHGEDYNYSLLLSRWMLFTETKNVGKLMTKISSGLVRNKGVPWLPELQDKSKFIIHLVLSHGGAHISRKECQNAPLLGHEEL